LGSRTIGFRTPLALLFVSLGMVAAVWWWLATPVALTRAPIDDAAKLECVSYAPFRGDQTPHDPTLIVSPEQIAEDLGELAKVSKCIRTYSIDNGLDKVPELASRVGLKVLLGVWIGRDRAKNALLINTAVSLVKDHPGVVAALIVGSEVLLRGDMTVGDLRDTIRSVKPRVNVPVTYADVWEFWLRYREVGEDVDFVTAHFLPYWEDVPPRAEDAAAHVDGFRKQVVAAFPGKEVLIGETGWPSHGRMRDGALASRVNQARFISQILERARQENFRVNFFEAYDEPWKRRWEGSVGGYWGLFDGIERKLKYPAGVAISNYPFWKLQMGGGLLLCICVFAVAWFAPKHRPSPPRVASWLAVAMSATSGGILLGISADKMLHESYGLGGWLLQGFLLAAAVTAPLLSTYALMSGRALPAFLEVLGPSKGLTPFFMANMLGITLIVTTLIAAQTALSLIFDSRWRDFPFAALTMAVVPFWTLAFLNGSKSGERPLSEAVFAGLFAMAAVYVAFNEGFENWQAMWTSAAYLLLGSALWRARIAVVAEKTSMDGR
jgi:exo-beta-1,3-glucanase (GH17 family)